MVDIDAIIAGIQAIHQVGKKVASDPWVREKAQKESDKKTLLGKLARVLGLAKGKEDPPSEPAEWFQRDEEEIVKGIRERLEGMKDEASAQAYLESVQNAVVDVKEAGENAVKEVTKKVTRDSASGDLLGSALDKYFDEDVLNAMEELEKAAQGSGAQGSRGEAQGCSRGGRRRQRAGLVVHHCRGNTRGRHLLWRRENKNRGFYIQIRQEVKQIPLTRRKQRVLRWLRLHLRQRQLLPAPLKTITGPNHGRGGASIKSLASVLVFVSARALE